jgi:hypothetical protein
MNDDIPELPQLVDSSDSSESENDSHSNNVSRGGSALNTERKFVGNGKNGRKLCRDGDEDCGLDRAKKVKTTKVERSLAINATCLITPRMIPPAVVQTINNTFKKVLFFTLLVVVTILGDTILDIVDDHLVTTPIDLRSRLLWSNCQYSSSGFSKSSQKTIH